MRFWDSSAIVPLLIAEAASAAVRALARQDAAMIVWRLARTEVVSALWRRRRAEELAEESRAAAEAGLGRLEGTWTSIDDVTHVDLRARRLLAVHPLRTADALHLAAALLACDEQPPLLRFVTLDDHLAEAARREGFHVLP
jgi:hypothetical protein